LGTQASFASALNCDEVNAREGPHSRETDRGSASAKRERKLANLREQLVLFVAGNQIRSIPKPFWQASLAEESQLIGHAR
jgi:hypothetical protein